MVKASPSVYNPRIIEPKWQKIWEKNKVFQVDLLKAKKPYYNLMMFPYPSAEGLHVGNMYAFAGSDIWGRYMSMKGHDVFEPIGLDGFGIHSENYALKAGRHPAKQAEISEKNFYRQLKMIGNMFSWDQKLETYDPDYYQWTQWIFIQLFKSGLAYRAKAPVNWCPSCKTVLADEQVIQGKCERCEARVEQKELEQWFFRITQYADRLLKNTRKIDWTEKILINQRHWIGRKEGINISYQVVGASGQPVSAAATPGLPITLNCFTTRPDTNFGAAFVVLAPEHPQLEQITSKEYKKAVSSYVVQALKKTKEQRIAEGSSKSGVFTGQYAINQLNSRKMPIWVSDFVLMEFGTGAVVGVPGHDSRDFQFAKEFDLPIVRVVVGPDGDKSPIKKQEQVQEESGAMVNSGFLNGLEVKKAIPRMMDYIEKKGWGKRDVSYHLRDWLISRQRYWGPPIPMVYCRACAEKGESWFTTRQAKIYMENLKSQAPNNKQYQNPKNQKSKQFVICNLEFDKCTQRAAGWYPVPEKDLPVLLPEAEDWRPKGTGRGPLDQLKDWKKVKCPACGREAQRETDVSDTFLDSAWYFLKYPSIKLKDKREKIKIKNSKIEHLRGGVAPAAHLGGEGAAEQPWNSEITKKWLPVDRYIGGAEHSVLHLMYSRFLCLVFKDLGLIDFEEPFIQFRAHGLIIKDGAKMSKSKGNIVIPDNYIKKYGADALRCYLMFLAPLNQGGDFRDTGMIGMHKFLTRVHKLVVANFSSRPESAVANFSSRPKSSLEKFWLHKTIKRVTKGIERLKYNTSLSALMEYVRLLENEKNPSLLAIQTLCLLIAPFAPHLAEELWQEINNYSLDASSYQLKNSIHRQPWPKFDPEYLKKDQIEIVVQINGKVRERLKVTPEEGENKERLITLAKKSAKIQRYLKGEKLKNQIFIPGKLLNFVI